MISLSSYSYTSEPRISCSILTMTAILLFFFFSKILTAGPDLVRLLSILRQSHCHIFTSDF